MLYIFSLLVILTATFWDKWTLVYAKPWVVLSLIIIYINEVSKINLWYLISMLFILITDTLVYLHFIKYFEIISILVSIYFVICSYLLKDYIAIKDIKVNSITRFPILISILLIGYLIFSITELVLPKISDSIWSLIIILFTLLIFAALCFFIYLADRYHGNIRLFIAASCCLFVNALVPINELYYYNRVFTVLINIAEIAGFYFFMKFLIDAKPIQIKSFDQKYF